MKQELQEIRNRLQDAVETKDWWIVKSQMNKLDTILYRNYLSVYNWIKYEAGNPETYPKEYGKYFVHRKDGKIHWETWNGSGWAYNNSVITHYGRIVKPNEL